MNILSIPNLALYEIFKYLSCKDICKLLVSNKNICKQLVADTDELELSVSELIKLKMEFIIYDIYYALYKQIISLKMNSILATQLTMRIITMGINLTYSKFRTNAFSSEAIIIRNILISEISCFLPEEENRIISLYYILYRTNNYSIFNRFIEDGIVISPFECTLSRNVRHTLHYYGNEQTLRVALRYKQYNMVKKILSNIYSIAAKNNFQNTFYFMWDGINFLFEPIYENDVEGFKLILDSIHNFNDLTQLLFGFDIDVIYGHNNNSYSFNERVIDINVQHISTEYNHVYYNYIKYDLITYALITDSKKMIKHWNWIYGFPIDLINNDFSIVDDNGDIKITITQKYLDYLNIQHNLLITYFNNCKSEFKFFNSIIERISLYNTDIKNIIIHPNPAFSIPLNIANSVLAVMYIKDIHSVDLSHRYLNNSIKYRALGRNSYTLIEFIKYWLYDIYINEDLFVSPDFVQLLLSYKELGGGFYIR